MIADATLLAQAADVIGRVAAAAASVDPDTRTITVEVADGAKALTPIVRELDLAGIAIDDLALRRPTLDEVFLHLTGQPGAADATPQPEHEEAR